MADQLYVVNQALAHLGQDQTDTVDPDDARSVVRKVLNHCDPARDAVLSRQSWLAARAYVSLSAVDGDNGNWRYGYRYNLPADGLRVFTVDSLLKWEQGTVRDPDTAAETKVIWSDEPGPINVMYVQRIAWTSMASSLADAVGYELAARAAYPVTGELDYAKLKRTEAEGAIRLAMGSDATQQGNQPATVPSHMRAARHAVG